jgi:hypothetical protein
MKIFLQSLDSFIMKRLFQLNALHNSTLPLLNSPKGNQFPNMISSNLPLNLLLKHIKLIFKLSETRCYLLALSGDASGLGTNQGQIYVAHYLYMDNLVYQGA